jgi:uncharacterized protein (TIGR02594 family)
MGLCSWLGKLFDSVTEKPNDRILTTAYAELGQKEIRGGENPRIIEYHAATTGKFDEDEVPWCASFVCWVLKQCGYNHTRSALAASYKVWGTKVPTLREALPGDVIVWRRGTDSNGKPLHHVHFLAEKYTGGLYYKAVGGNQGDAVTVANYVISKIMEIRRVSI